jgi:acetyl esterase
VRCDGSERHRRGPGLGLASLAGTLRRRVGGLAVDSFFRGASSLGRLHPRSDPARHQVEVLRDRPYREGGDPCHLLDVYRPTTGAGPWPTVLYVHGGGFRILSKDTHWVMGLALARRGLVVFNINYRLSPRHPFPAALEDTCAAYRWLLEHASDFGGDPGRIALAGESAGANLVTSLVVACCYPRREPWARAVFETGVVPRAVLPACGVFQVSDPGRFARRRRLARWVQDRLEEVSQAYLGEAPDDPVLRELADPLLLLERGAPPERPLPPFFLAVGTRDVLLDDTRRLAAALERLGVPREARIFPGEVHAFQAFVWREAARRFWRDAHAFLARNLGEATSRRS